MGNGPWAIGHDEHFPGLVYGKLARANLLSDSGPKYYTGIKWECNEIGVLNQRRLFALNQPGLYHRVVLDMRDNSVAALFNSRF